MSTRVLFLILLVLAFSGAIQAQTSSTLQGQVLDPSGAVIPKAGVAISGPNGLARQIETDNLGSFLIQGLAAGAYSVRISAVGFAVVEKSVDLSEGRATRLQITLAVALERQQVSVAETLQVQIDPASNASAIVIEEKQLDILSDNPDDLEADLLALAGPAVGPEGGQIYIDGFSNGQLPPKESIREVRVNADPFSAQYDRPGFGRVEVLTRSGTDRFRGSAAIVFADSALNSRNPYSFTKPHTQMRQYQTEVMGPIGKKASFNIEANHANQDQTALINALVLDDSFRPVPFVANIPVPNDRTTFSPRVDYALTPNDTLQARYSVNRTTAENNDIGNFSLLSRATSRENTQQNMQVTETSVIGSRLINEARFQYRRSRTHQTGDSISPTISVLDAFTGGGANFNVNYYHSDNWEFQDYTSYTHGAHFIRAGVRLRAAIESGFAQNNFNGMFTFTSLAAYAITQQGIAHGLTIGEIRALGGGASQYSVASGSPLAGIGQVDIAPFFQEDWKARPNATVSFGLRYETQTNLRNHNAWAPRVGIAWGIGRSGRRATQPKTVLRAGFGLYYDRLNEGTLVVLKRQNGITQQNYVVPFPNFFPVAPPPSQLLPGMGPQTIRSPDPNLQASQTIQSAFGIERQLPRNITVAVNYTNSRGVHQFGARNINAPLPGTYLGPGTGVFPLGAAAGQVYRYESNGIYKQSQISVNVNARVNAKISLFGNYSYGRVNSDADGFNMFPANSYDRANEWARTNYDIRNRLQAGGNIAGPLGVQFAPQITANSGPPVNITLGRDANGDSLFNDRPAFATDLTRPSVRATRWGVFDASPIAGQGIIPRNYGFGYATLGINLRASRTWGFGERPAPTGRTGRGGGSTTRYSMTASVQGRNLINHVNPGAPNGNLSSPFFGISTNSQGGTTAQNANRRLEMQLRFAF
jgi:hypothetical protein